MKWKHLIPNSPSIEEFNEAWKLVFGFYPKECRVSVFEDGNNKGFTVYTPSEIHSHGGFGEHTESPILKNESKLYYDGYGCSWGIDDRGQRYHKLSKKTGLPANWEEVRAQEIIKKYIADYLDKGANNLFLIA